MQGAALQRARVGKLPLLESPVGVQQFGALGPQRGHLSAQRLNVAVFGAAHLDGHLAGAVVGHRAAAPRQRFGDPAGQLDAALVGHRVHLLVRPALLGDGRDVHPAVVLHRPQRAVDLLMGGGPEVADGPVEPAGQLVSGAGLFAQRHQYRVGKGHAGSLEPDREPYATCCTASRRIRCIGVRSAAVTATAAAPGVANWLRSTG